MLRWMAVKKNNKFANTHNNNHVQTTSAIHKSTMDGTTRLHYGKVYTHCLHMRNTSTNGTAVMKQKWYHNEGEEIHGSNLFRANDSSKHIMTGNRLYLNCINLKREPVLWHRLEESAETSNSFTVHDSLMTDSTCVSSDPVESKADINTIFFSFYLMNVNTITT